MHVSNNFSLPPKKQITGIHYFVFFIWLFCTVIAAVYFISGRLVNFDPESKLIAKSSGFVIQQLKKMQQLKGIDLSDTIIHFTSQNCSCTQYSEAHKKEINIKAGKDGFNIINVSLPANLTTIIPATPAILIVDKAEQLLYFGPYSIGLACSESNGYVETVLQNYGKGYSASLIINDATGCYCNL